MACGGGRHTRFFLARGHPVTAVDRDTSGLADIRSDPALEIVETDLATGDERTVYAAGGYAIAGSFSPDGAFVSFTIETERSGDNELYLVDLDRGERRHVTPHEDAAYSSGPAWLANGTGFYFATDIDRDVAAIAFYDMARGGWDHVIEPGWAVPSKALPSSATSLS